MQFTFHENAKEASLKIDGDLHKYLFKVRRHDASKNIYFRNLTDNFIYEYKIVSTSRRDTILELISKEEKIIKPKKYLHIGWCIIDFKNIEKVLASLNEIGVSKITFITCEYSQRNTKINYAKLNKILVNSSSQSGRSNTIEFDEINSLEEFIKLYPDTYMFNFSSNNIQESKNDIKTIVLGCEGGFSKGEIEMLDSNKIVGVKSCMIMRSETAIISIASKVLF
jgi:16S rRNA (uracil1498-N3)-methyltransferase